MTRPDKSMGPTRAEMMGVLTARPARDRDITMSAPTCWYVDLVECGRVRRDRGMGSMSLASYSVRDLATGKNGLA